MVTEYRLNNKKFNLHTDPTLQKYNYPTNNRTLINMLLERPLTHSQRVAWEAGNYVVNYGSIVNVCGKLTGTIRFSLRAQFSRTR